MTTLIKKYNDARVYLINDASIVQKMALSILFAVILAAASQIKIFLSFTPVPINLGTFAVCMAGMTLGGFWGFVSVAIYMLAAAVGLPVIAGSSLIGAAGVSAEPMAARVANKVGQESNPQNFLLMHAMGPNVSGVIGSAVAAGVLLAILG